MGGAESKNVANAVANITNSVSQETVANTDQINKIQQSAVFSQCDINVGNDFTVHYAATNASKNSQILNAIQDTAITNKIGQELQQLAQSKVGFLGIGYAKASNSASTTANATNTVKNIMTAVCNQLNISDQTFICDRSTINAKNLNIDFSSSASFMSDQTLSNKQTTNLANDITQSISQKASATVQGGVGFLLLLILLICAVAYCLSEPLESTLDSGAVKIVIAVCVMIGVFILLIWLYLIEAPPLFNPPQECVPGSIIGCKHECVNVKDEVMSIDAAPLRYNYPIITTNSDVSLAGMVIYKFAGGSINNGYNLQTYFDLGGTTTDADTGTGKLNLDIYYNDETIYPNEKPEQCPNLLCLPTDPSDSSQRARCLVPNRYWVTDNGVCCSPATATQVVSDTDNDDCSGVVKCQKSSDNNPLFLITILNISEWTNYLNKSNLHKKHARFVLCQYLTIPCNIFIASDELVTISDENNETIIAQADTVRDRVLCFTDFGSFTDFSSKINSGGKLRGKVGTCNTQSYKFQQFCRKIGIWIVVLIVIAVFLFIILYTRQIGKKTNK
jgi:hypothetical protein